MTAGPLRRLGAMMYDTFLIVAVLIVATIPFFALARGKVLVPDEVGALAYVYWLCELAVVYGFFGLFWTQRGQTLGMQAWGLRVETATGALPTWRDVALRLVAAAVPWLPACVVLAIADHSSNPSALRPIGFGLAALVLLNYFAAWFDPQRRSLHDRMLRTVIVRR